MKIDRRDLFKWVAGGTAALGINSETTRAEAKAAAPPPPIKEPTEREKEFPTNLSHPMYDVRNWALYDTFDTEDRLISRFGRADLFCHAGYEENYRDRTNMYMPQRLSMPKQFLIERVFITFSDDSPSVRSFVKASTLRIIVGQKIMLEASLDVFGIVKHSPLILNENLHPSGICPPGAMVLHPNPLHIDSGCNFYAEIQTAAVKAETPFTGRVYLDGQMARGIQ